jgi:hypothetical protein
MAFCTQCGATLKGAFCTQCGTRAGVAVSPAPEPSASPAAPQDAAPLPPAAAGPPRRKTNPIVWVLVIVLGVFGLGFLAMVGGGLFLAHKVRQEGAGVAIAKILAAVNPNLEVVRTNEAAGTVTLRERDTGKEFSISIDAARNGRFSLDVQEGDKAASIEIGGDARIPDWVPQYPGSRPKQLFSAKGESEREAGEAGSFTFNTPDPASQVIDFYEQKARESGLPVRLDSRGTLVAGDREERGRGYKVVTRENSGETFVSVTFGRKL